LTTIYLVRHGQAGTRGSYDSLSDLGRKQSRLLGEYFISQKIVFAAAYSGALSRQRGTAAEVCLAYREACLPFPEVAVESAWNEFDLDHIYREIGPKLCADDQQFKLHFETMRRQVRSAHGAEGDGAKRRWLPCDTEIVHTWIRGRYQYSGESWEQFRSRVVAWQTVADPPEGRAAVAVFTSATPVAIWTGLALGILDERLIDFAGVLQNSSFTVLRLRDKQRRLFAFNAVPHLASACLRSLR
jgi:broad specificity phosphatase PhoE